MKSVILFPITFLAILAIWVLALVSIDGVLSIEKSESTIFSTEDMVNTNIVAVSSERLQQILASERVFLLSKFVDFDKGEIDLALAVSNHVFGFIIVESKNETLTEKVVRVLSFLTLNQESRKEVANTKFSLVDWSGDVFYTHHIIIHQTTKGWTHPLVVEEKVLALFIEGLKQQQEEALVALYEEY